MKIHGNACYIPKGKISQEILQRDLVFRPRASSYTNGKQPDPYYLYIETETGYIIPRRYSELYFKLSNITFHLGEPLSPECKSLVQPDIHRKQPEAIRAVYHCFDKQPDSPSIGILALPCGFGKTATSIHIACHYGRKTMIIVQNQGLGYQWKERIEQYVPGARIGYLIQSTNDIETSDFIIASLQSLIRHIKDYKYLNQIGFTIIDECHHYLAPTYFPVLLQLECKYILGLSATPKQHKCADYIMGPVLYKPHIQRDLNTTIHIMTYVSKNKPIYQKWGNKQEDIPAMLKQIINDTTRTKYIIQNICEYYKQGRNILVVSKLLDQLKLLHRILTEFEHVPEQDIGFYIGKIKNETRNEYKGRRIVLASEQLGREGLDAPHLNTLILATPLGGTTQVVGRIQRLIQSQDLQDSFTSYKYPLVYYIHDPYGTFNNQYVCNKREFKKQNYNIIET